MLEFVDSYDKRIVISKYAIVAIEYFTGPISKIVLGSGREYLIKMDVDGIISLMREPSI